MFSTAEFSCNDLKFRWGLHDFHIDHILRDNQMNST